MCITILCSVNSYRFKIFTLPILEKNKQLEINLGTKSAWLFLCSGALVNK